MARGMLRMDLGTFEAFKDDRFPISGHVAGIIEDWLKAEEDVWINLMAFLEDGPSGDANRKNDLKKFADSLFAHGQRTSSIVAALQRCADREEEESRRYRREFESIRKLIDLAKRDLFTYLILLCVGVGCLSLAVRELVFPIKHRKQKKESL